MFSITSKWSMFLCSISICFKFKKKVKFWALFWLLNVQQVLLTLTSRLTEPLLALAPTLPEAFKMPREAVIWRRNPEAALEPVQVGPPLCRFPAKPVASSEWLTGTHSWDCDQPSGVTCNRVHSHTIIKHCVYRSEAIVVVNLLRQNQGGLETHKRRADDSECQQCSTNQHWLVSVNR